MRKARAFALLLMLDSVVLAQQPTPILIDPILTPGDTFDVTAPRAGIGTRLKQSYFGYPACLTACATEDWLSFNA